jgi:phage-related holin
MKDIAIFRTLSLIPAFIFGIPSNMIGLLVVFIIIDTVTGTILSYVVDGKHSLKSRIMTTGVISKGLAILVPLMLASFGHVSQIQMQTLAQGLLGVLLVAEMYSVIGNIISIKKRERMKEIDAFSFVLLQVQKMLLKMSGYKGDLEKEKSN